MGVIVPRAKMPNNCEECDLKALCEDYWKNIREAYTRPSWCSLDDIDTMYFCGVPMKEAVEAMRMYKNGELVHLADRKTENCSEKPNNCEHITEDGVTCAKYPACDDCLDNPLNKVKGSKRLVKGSEQTDLVEDSPSLVKDLVKAFGEDGTWLERQGVYTLTLAEAKQRAVDIIESVLAKDEPTISKMEQVEDETRLTAKCLNCANGGSYKCSKCDGEMYYKYDKDEPQTCSVNGRPYDCGNCEYFKCTADEPQTDCAWMKGE